MPDGIKKTGHHGRLIRSGYFDNHPDVGSEITLKNMWLQNKLFKQISFLNSIGEIIHTNRTTRIRPALVKMRRRRMKAPAEAEYGCDG